MSGLPPATAIFNEEPEFHEGREDLFYIHPSVAEVEAA